MLISGHLAELYTGMAADVGFQFEGYDGLITAFTDGGNQVRYLFFYVFKGNFIALSIIPIVLVLMFVTRKASRNLEQSQSTPELAE